jgi:glycosyltransferase involved in cell wall biosynthesis
MMKVDLHVHSKFSKRPSQWVLQKIGCPESFTEPLQIYRIARDRGMSLVTITDHNTIEGALEIAHLPGTFISEEITSYFPEDGCKIHVLALNITENHHQDIQKIRKNIFDLAAYLNREGIVHAIAHPLYAVNDRLTIEHFERMLLLFKNFELNGARNERQRQNLKRILSSLTPEDIENLSEKHKIEPSFPDPWQKILIGGSDDHSGLNIARTYTRIGGEATLNDLMKGIKSGLTEVLGQASTPLTMAHNLYSIAYQFYRNRLNLSRHADKDRLLRFLDRSLCPECETESNLMSKVYFFFRYRGKNRSVEGMPDTLMGLIRQETDKLLKKNPQLMDIAGNENEPLKDREKRWFEFVDQVSNQVLSHTANHLFGHLSGANVFNIFQTIGAAGGLYSLLAPYFVSFAQFTKDRELNEAILNRFAGKEFRAPLSGFSVKSGHINGLPVNVAHFTDTFYDVNGVAQTLQQQVEMSLKNRKRQTIITCDAENQTEKPGIQNFRPIGVFDLPEYNVQKIYYPPFLEMLNYCYEQRFTHIQCATPGPIGLAALAIARILKLPASGTYHTAFPQYAQYLTGDAMIEELTWRYMIWYYDQMDVIYVSSQSSADELIEKGIKPEKIKQIPRGIDTDAFHPAKRNGLMKSRYGIQEQVKFLYVGRVSKEKNLHLLVDAFKKVREVLPDIHLVVAGDGPYLKEMRNAMKGLPCTFTGYLKGDDLYSVYASSDIFVFPSTTDTFGNVVLEAQASGLPVIVTDQGGPCENIIPHETGLIVKGNDRDDLVRAMIELGNDADRRMIMARGARQCLEDRSFENAFIEYWKFFEQSPNPFQAGLAKAG